MTAAECLLENFQALPIKFDHHLLEQPHVPQAVHPRLHRAADRALGLAQVPVVQHTLRQTAQIDRLVLEINSEQVR